MRYMELIALSLTCLDSSPGNVVWGKPSDVDHLFAFGFFDWTGI